MTGPVIGVVSEDEPSQLALEAVNRAGGQPWVISPLDCDISEVLEKAGALFYPHSQEVTPEDLTESSVLAAEVGLMRAALDVDMPVYAIGRGFQVLNVAQGGSVAEVVEEHHADDEDGEERSKYHHLYMSPGSKLAAVVGSGGFVRVNSRHRYGAREAQKSGLLLASAYGRDDGVIEALESPRHRWVIGVQFRPELRLEIPPHFDRLMQSLVERAAERLHATKAE
jgi:putative glutamine amidotransferase